MDKKRFRERVKEAGYYIWEIPIVPVNRKLNCGCSELEDREYIFATGIQVWGQSEERRFSYCDRCIASWTETEVDRIVSWMLLRGDCGNPSNPQDEDTNEC